MRLTSKNQPARFRLKRAILGTCVLTLSAQGAMAATYYVATRPADGFCLGASQHQLDHRSAGDFEVV